MRRIASLLGIGVLAVLGCSCSFAMRPVRFDAGAADWESLTGHWRGDYTITGRDRHGLIEFRLKGLTHEATGDVLMIFERTAWPVTGMPPKDGMPPQPPLDSQLLAIQFVAVDHGMIRGNMERYWDPDRGCNAWGTFLGSVDGHVISGSFTSVCDDGMRVLHGRWRVERSHDVTPSSLSHTSRPSPYQSVGTLAVRSARTH